MINMRKTKVMISGSEGELFKSKQDGAMWSLLEESNGQFGVVYGIWKQGSW